MKFKRRSRNEQLFYLIAFSFFMGYASHLGNLLAIIITLCFVIAFFFGLMDKN